MTENEKFKNLIIVPHSVFNEWRKIVETERKMSNLDKIMRNIMKKKKLSDLEKWNLYKYQLIKYANFKRIAGEKNKLQSELPMPDNRQQQISNYSRESKFRRVPTKFNRESLEVSAPATSTKNKELNTESNEDLLENLKDPTEPYKEDFYENIPQKYENFNEVMASSSMIEPASQENMEVENEGNYRPAQNYNFDEDLEFELHKHAEKLLNAKHPIDVVRRSYSLGRDYRSFDDKTTGDNVLINVSPIKRKLDKVYKNMSDTQNAQLNASHMSVKNALEKSIKKPKQIKGPRTKKLVEHQVYGVQTRGKLKKLLSSKEIAEEEIIRKGRSNWDNQWKYAI